MRGLGAEEVAGGAGRRGEGGGGVVRRVVKEEGEVERVVVRGGVVRWRGRVEVGVEERGGAICLEVSFVLVEMAR